MSISVEGRAEDATVSLGQYILIEGDNDDSPFVAQLLKLYTDGRNMSCLYPKYVFCMLSESDNNLCWLINICP